MTDQRRLSKTDWMWARRCQRAVWLRHHARQDATEPPPIRELVLRNGDRVDLFAQTVYPGGYSVEARHLDEAAVETRDALDNGASRIYQATVLADWGGCRADVVDVHSDRSITIREVKSTGSVHDEHVWDVAVQCAMFEDAGWTIRSAHVVHISVPAISPLDADGLAEKDVTNDALSRGAVVRDLARDAIALLDASEPDVEVGRHCLEPYRCPYVERCWAGHPPSSVHLIPGVSRTALRRWRREGVATIEDVPPHARLSRRAREYVTRRTRPRVVDVERLGRWLELLGPSYVALGIVADQSPIPRVAGVHPFEAVPVAVSVATADGEEALIGTRPDPRVDLSYALASALPRAHNIVVFGRPEQSTSPEPDVGGLWARRVLRRLAAFAAPEARDALLQACGRVLDIRPVIEEFVEEPLLVDGSDLPRVASALLGRSVDAESMAVVADDWFRGGDSGSDATALSSLSARVIYDLTLALSAVATGHSS